MLFRSSEHQGDEFKTKFVGTDRIWNNGINGNYAMVK